MARFTVQIDDRLDPEPTVVAVRAGTSKRAFVRDAVQGRSAIVGLEQLRRVVAPFAKAHGWLTDEDVFREVS